MIPSILQKVGYSTEILGSLGNDSLSSSTTEIAYGLQGNDTFRVINDTFEPSPISVGGQGSDLYIVDDSQAIVVLDAGNSDGDVLQASGIDLNNSDTFALELLDRDLIIFDTFNDQLVFIVDWKKSENKIEEFRFESQTLSYDQFVQDIQTSGTYIGNFTSTQTITLANGEIFDVDFGTTSEDLVTFQTAKTAIVDRSKELELGKISVGETVYRFYEPTKGVHFYTADRAERDSVEQNLKNYNLEGESYVTPDSLSGKTEEVYRFFNSKTGVHLYTTDEVERESIQKNLPNFSFEGTAFYAYQTDIGPTIPIYRFYEPTKGVHFYTPSEAERDSVEKNLPNYTFEGIAYYAFPVDYV